ncbi:synaptic vesicle glycoprotein 2B [Plutella xylostella]|uniref:synaptic vesicle glycoprotein 2B n=1 Tax=Plutella xylostella TaxID=51655 RepID=UPI0020323FBD|nr:synaptic vesicle glycoprotein 2B [Plutella xylostella]
MQEAAKQHQQIVFSVEDKEQKQVTKCENNEVPFEEALNMTGVGRYTVGLFVACVVTVLAMAMETFGTSYVATACACDLRLSTATKGLVSAMPMLGVLVSLHLWGWLADTRGRRFVLLVSMGGCFVSALASSLANDWVTLAVFKFVAAFFASASNAVPYALLGESTPAAHRHTLVMMMASGLMLGQFAMSANAYPILRLSFDLPLFGGMRYRPWRLLQQAYGSWSGAAALLLLVFVKESPKFYASQGRPDMSVKVLAEIYAINTGKSKEDYPVNSISFHETLASSKQTSVLRSMWDQTTPLFRKPLLLKTIVILYIVILVYAIAPAFLMWMPSITTAFSRATAAGATDANFCQMLHFMDQATPSVASNGTSSPIVSVFLGKSGLN